MDAIKLDAAAIAVFVFKRFSDQCDLTMISSYKPTISWTKSSMKWTFWNVFISNGYIGSDGCVVGMDENNLAKLIFTDPISSRWLRSRYFLRFSVKNCKRGVKQYCLKDRWALVFFRNLVLSILFFIFRNVSVFFPRSLPRPILREVW